MAMQRTVRLISKVKNIQNQNRRRADINGRKKKNNN